jgi:hypothetical protein
MESRAKAGTALGSGVHSPLGPALPVSRRRWVLLVRVAPGSFLLESCTRRGRFLLTFFRPCACSEAVREEILREGEAMSLGPQSALGNRAVGGRLGGDE